MQSPQSTELSDLQRLALAYAPARARELTETLMRLDNRLAAVLRLGGEPMIAQIKLAWWRDRLREDAVNWPQGEPLLAALRVWPGDVGKLALVVDGWETLLAEKFGERELEDYAAGRAAGWSALATAFGAEPAAVELAARQWALADLLPHLGNESEVVLVKERLAGSPAPPRLPRELRSLAVLRRLALRAARLGSSEPLHGPGALFGALRAGLTGR